MLLTRHQTIARGLKSPQRDPGLQQGEPYLTLIVADRGFFNAITDRARPWGGRSLIMTAQ